MSDDSSKDLTGTDVQNRRDGLDLLWKIFFDANAWIERAHKTWLSLLIPYCLVILFAKDTTKISGVSVEKIYAVIFFGTGILFCMLAVLWHVLRAISLQAALASRNGELAEFPQIAEKVRDHYSKFSYTNPLKEMLFTHNILLLSCLITIVFSIIYDLLLSYGSLQSTDTVDSYWQFLINIALDWRSITVSLLVLFFFFSSWGIWEVLVDGFEHIGFQSKKYSIDQISLMRAIRRKRLLVILIPIILVLFGQVIVGLVAYR